MASDVRIRSAQRADLAAAARLGAKLARAHHEWDPERFFIVESMEEGYAWWLGKELSNRRAAILVAERRGKVIGYAYGRIEPRDWNSLRDECGVTVDLILDDGARGRGVGRLLHEALLAALREKGAARVVLQVAAKNRAGQRFFRAMGFRPTLVEMTRELGEPLPRARRRR
jgi:ribosomal protein S18 acetylase RimI-like enzyme